MKQDLETLRKDIERQLQDGAYVVYHAETRFADDSRPILWDTQGHPNPGEFLETALSVGVKLIVYHHREFTAEALDQAGEKLEAAELPRDQHRDMERQLRRMQGYIGFTSAIELSFDFDARTYLYEMTAPWYDEYLGLLDDIDDAIDFDDEPPSMGGGYFSQN